MTAEPGLGRLNALPEAAARAELLACCGSERWASRVAAARPFASVAALREVAREAWYDLEPDDRREAFAAHPEIGGEREGSDPTRAWSRREQSSMEEAGGETRALLAAGQRAYRERFGYIFLIRATGRSPEEMLSALRRRLGHDPEEEFAVASDEQWEIIEIRLARLLEQEGVS